MIGNVTDKKPTDIGVEIEGRPWYAIGPFYNPRQLSYTR